MNGAELPSGHCIGVQPAQTNHAYSIKKPPMMKSETHDKIPSEPCNDTITDEAQISSATTEELDIVETGVPGSSNNSMAMMSDAKARIEEKDDDDLDDFFASLE